MIQSKVQAGERLHITADTFNTLLEVAEEFKRSKRIHGRKQPQRSRDQGNTTVWLRNVSGIDVPQYGVLGLNGPAIGPTQNETEFRNQLVLDAGEPTELHLGRFAILKESSSGNTLVRGCVSGITICRVRMLSPDHTRADVAPGVTTELYSSVMGSADLLWVEPEEDRDPNDPQLAWAVVNLGAGNGAGTRIARFLVVDMTTTHYLGREVGPDNQPIDPTGPTTPLVTMRFPQDPLQQCVPLIPLNAGPASIVPAAQFTMPDPDAGATDPQPRWLCLLPFLGFCLFGGGIVLNQGSNGSTNASSNLGTP